MKIKLENISASYDIKEVLRDINLEINDGEFICIIGTSGCGKTTLLKLINGLVKPSKGNVLIDQKLLESYDIIALRKKMGYVIQDHCLFPHLSVYDNIAYVLDIDHVEEKIKHERVLELVKLMNLEQTMLYEQPHNLSGGQQQRVGIARALANWPLLVLMDEPFGALDAITRKKLQKELKQIQDILKINIVLVTHDINEALLLATRIIVMDEGRIIQDDTPANIIAHPVNDYVVELIS
ncbi:MAG: ATP-binding cassette domain-containing protein [Bacilli bacterium]